jgi:sterol desaturase/sphingolipid hydroxylase (fatty acid hydroxylase superfamily)
MRRDAKKEERGLPAWITIGAAVTALGALTLAEVRRPLRRRQREPKSRRVARNLALATVTAATTALVQIAVLAPVARETQRDRRGLLYRTRLPRPLRVVAGVLLLDYTLWWWHWMNHEVPLLWRFHLVHHVDLDMDASTALRFHPGEMGLSIFYRALQFRVLGIDPLAASIWQTALLVSILFHHSDLRISEHIERHLVRWIVTPRMHGIHHSDRREETDSNWSSLFSWWDFLQGTFRFDVPPERITIGVPAWQDAKELTLGSILEMPLRRQKEDWRRPSEVERPPRED